MHSFFARCIIALASVLLLPAAAGQAQTPRATITFDNKSGELALVKVIGPTGRRTEVPDRQKRTVKVVGGQYYLLVRYGAKPGSYHYTKGDRFKVTQTATRYSIITITLHKVVGGNYGSEPSSPEEFERGNP